MHHPAISGGKMNLLLTALSNKQTTALRREAEKAGALSTYFCKTLGDRSREERIE
jgi:hypothetical protein